MTSSLWPESQPPPPPPQAKSTYLCLVELARPSLKRVCVSLPPEIEMVIMERCKLLSATEQNITDEEKSAAASEMCSWNRWARGLLPPLFCDGTHDL